MTSMSNAVEFLKTTTLRAGGLRASLMVAVLAAIVLPAVLIGYLMVDRSYYPALAQEHTQKAEKYADLLQGAMAQPLWDFAPEAGRQILASASLDPSVIQVSVWDDKQHPFLEYRTPNPVQRTEDALRIKRPIKTASATIGSLELVYSLASVRVQANKLSNQLATVILIQAATSVIVLLFFLHRRVLNPIDKLEHAAAILTESNLDVPIPYIGNDELGKLAHQLELMRDSVKRSFSQLESEIIERTRANSEIKALNTNLETRVQERTAELLEANITLAQTLEDLRNAQRTLVQSEKLASLGSLVAGVAHELNTPIGNGLAAASTMEDETSHFRKRLEMGIRRSELEHFIATTEEGSRLVRTSLQRAAELVGSFKQVAVDQIGAQRRMFELAETVHETILTLSPTLKRTHIRLEQDVPSGIMLDSFPGALSQVISNLVNNALIHAFEDRPTGTMRIMAKRADDEHIYIEFSDDGTGIPENNLSKIYDPFFTTKFGQGGSGLGLHIVHNIVTGVLGGEIAVRSVQSEGTTFSMAIPVKAP